MLEPVSCVAGPMTKFGFGDHTEDPVETIKSIKISGYLIRSGDATKVYTGKELEKVLIANYIDLNGQLPFISLIANATSKSYGVVKMDNIPFTVTAQEIAQFIKKYASTPTISKHYEGCPIHIIMEKPTGKTMDCYVEFPNHAAASQCVENFSYATDGDKATKIHDRNVSIDLSDQQELLNAIFPLARFVTYDPIDGEAKQMAWEEKSGWSRGFQGFITLEEMFGVVKFADSPNRSPFVHKCQQRVYECMISTLYKFPWSSPKLYTVAARNTLFETVHKQLSILYRKIAFPNKKGRYEGRQVGLGQPLLLDLLSAAMNVPVFSLFQKHILCQAIGSYGTGIRKEAFWQTWPFQTLQPEVHTPAHVVKFWLEIFETGFDILQEARAPTSFEKYLVVNRNYNGFLVCEWTPLGTNLSFAKATRVEQEVMKKLVVTGREAWAWKRCISVTRWSSQTCGDLLAILHLQDEELDFRRGQDGDNISPETDANVSPKSSLTYELIEDKPESSTMAAMVPSASTSASRSRAISNFNPATAMEFVRGSRQHNLAASNATSSTTFTNPFASNDKGKRPATRKSISVAPHETTAKPAIPVDPEVERQVCLEIHKAAKALRQGVAKRIEEARQARLAADLEHMSMHDSNNIQFTRPNFQATTIIPSRPRHDTISTSGFSSAFSDDDPFAGLPGRSRTLPNIGYGLNAAQDFGPVGSRRNTIAPITKGSDHSFNRTYSVNAVENSGAYSRTYSTTDGHAERRATVAPIAAASEAYDRACSTTAAYPRRATVAPEHVYTNAKNEIERNEAYEKMRAKSIPSNHRAVQNHYGGWGGDGRNEGRGRLSGSELFLEVSKGVLGGFGR